MARAPRRPCKHPGCAELTYSPTRLCEIHRKEAHKAYTRYNRTPEERRFYASKTWKQIRAKQLFASPSCMECGKPANIVDHLIPRKDGGSDEPANLRSLCRSCHSKATVKHDGGYGKPKTGKRYFYDRRMWI